MSNILFRVLLLLSFILLSLTKGIAKEKVVVAINCGGREYKDRKGLVYIADTYYDRGSTSDHGLNYDIQGTEDMPIYQSERWSSETLTYSIPLTQPGKYTFILKFSEVYFSRPREKVFDIALGNLNIIEGLDIFAKVGRETALDEFIEFELRKGKIYYKNKEVPSAYDEYEQKVKLRFVKGPKDNPKINGIILIKGGLENTDYVEKKRAMEETKKKKFREQKQKYVLDLRHNPDEDYDEETLLNFDETFTMNKDEGILSIFFTAPGIAIILSVFVFFGLNYLIDFI